MRPSFLAATFGGILLTIATIMYLLNYKSLSAESHMNTLFLMSAGWTLHALLHHYEEIYYDFNPLVGKWKVRDNKK
jgi:hypothetical protein